MPITLEGGCRVSDLREGEPVSHGTLRIWNQIGRATGAQAISLRVLEFAPGLSPGILNVDCDEILFVLDEFETGTPPSTVFIDGHRFEAGADTGIYLRPGETFAVDNPGPDQLVMISSQCPDPVGDPQFVAPLMTAGAERNGPSPIVRLSDRPSLPTADRWYRVLVDDEVGSLQATQFVGSIPPGRAPGHFHHYEEVLFILRGRGRMWAGETNTPIAPGSCIYLPKGQLHCVENTGTDELRLLGVFYPAGSPSVRYEV